MSDPNAPNPNVSGPASAKGVQALVINVFLPGLGTLLGGGPTGVGVAQLILFGVGVLTTIFLIGIPLVIGAWVWGLVTGFQIMSASTSASPPPTGGGGISGP